MGAVTSVFTSQKINIKAHLELTVYPNYPYTLEIPYHPALPSPLPQTKTHTHSHTHTDKHTHIHRGDVDLV